jgi:hypothetical protein
VYGAPWVRSTLALEMYFFISYTSTYSKIHEIFFWRGGREWENTLHEYTFYFETQILYGSQVFLDESNTLSTQHEPDTCAHVPTRLLPLPPSAAAAGSSSLDQCPLEMKTTMAVARVLASLSPCVLLQLRRL